jgi:molecular chaperone GrpE
MTYLQTSEGGRALTTRRENVNDQRPEETVTGHEPVQDTPDPAAANGADVQESQAVEEELTAPAEAAEAPADAGSAEAAEAAAEEAGDATAPVIDPAELKRLQAELQETRQHLLRVHADFDNFRKRTRQEMEDLRRFAARQLLLDLLPIADNFERALSAFSSGNVEEIRTGVEMVHRQLLGVLEKHGVRPMEVVGAPFDPNMHEAVMQEPADGRDAGVVVEELQKGYTLHEKVLRPAMVKVTV